ncbi:hypothetical protein EDC32_1011252 [Laceyella sacchari]|nr:hypothetical protein EDC32_1011252 [Laceyella sacchari]
MVRNCFLMSHLILISFLALNTIINPIYTHSIASPYHILSLRYKIVATYFVPLLVSQTAVLIVITSFDNSANLTFSSD